jgi:deoxyribonuclease-4
MPPVGAHMSIAGGFHKAVDRAAAYGMTALQLFTRSARTWRSAPLAGEAVRLFRERLEESPVEVVVAHASYLVNPASPDRALRRRSERALVEEITRCERLGVPWLVLHPGSHRGTAPGAGLRRAAGVLQRVLEATSGFRAGILVENSAGQGDSLGTSFEEIASLLGRAGDGMRLGACLDTCHAFAAGYDLRTADGYGRARDALDRAVGLDRVTVVHVNDSRCPLGSRFHRHAGIGMGEMGHTAFRRLVRDPVLGRRPLILETPKGRRGGKDLDALNLAVLRGFSQGGPGRLP